MIEIKDDDAIVQAMYGQLKDEYLLLSLTTEIFISMLFFLIHKVNKIHKQEDEYKKACIVFLLKKILRDNKNLSTLDRDHYYGLIDSTLIYVISESLESKKVKSAFNCFKK